MSLTKMVKSWVLSLLYMTKKNGVLIPETILRGIISGSMKDIITRVIDILVLDGGKTICKQTQHL